MEEETNNTKKISVTEQVKELLAKSTPVEEIIKTVGITNKRFLDIRWQLNKRNK